MPVPQQFVANYNLGGLNLYVNPLTQGINDQVLAFDGELIRSVNMDTYPIGAKQKRPGYSAFLNNSDSSQINTLFSWTKDDGTTTFIYRFSNSTLYYYTVGGTQTTWLPTSGNTFLGSHIGYAILGNTMLVGDGVGSTAHTTNGTSFTPTVLAPVGEFFEQYHNRVYIGGTVTPSTLFYSTRGDATNWNTSGTSDSSDITIPDSGQMGKLAVLADNLVISKNSGKKFRWDDFNLFDMSTDLGPSSPYSYGEVEGVGFYLNRLGVYSDQGNGETLISNPIQREIYNDRGVGIAGTTFNTAPGIVYVYDYMLSVGTITDDFTNEEIPNAVIKYNYQKNEFLNYSLYDRPTAFGTYVDVNQNRQLLFGNSSGQVFQYGGTATTDNGQPISTVMEFTFNLNQPHIEKYWRWIVLFFNPGCEAQIQVATSDTFDRKKKDWKDIGQATSGLVKYRFETGSRSHMLWVRIKDNSRNARYTCYGMSISAVLVDIG